MAKRLTVFYSWQSDSPSNLNRTFIEKALAEALKRVRSDVALEGALRDTEIELDRDTAGIGGSPPIAETILKKIDECAVFVADLSFVGESKGDLKNLGKVRQFPNPNVLIEYGYALHCHSHSRVIGIMNAAFGAPNEKSLPFDLRHLRWPITYCLSDAGASDKHDQLAKLTRTLAEAIGLVLSENPSEPEVVDKYVPKQATTSAAVFFHNPEDLVSDRKSDFSVPVCGKAYLRLYPTRGKDF